jgi:hypothetical protein
MVMKFPKPILLLAPRRQVGREKARVAGKGQTMTKES